MVVLPQNIHEKGDVIFMKTIFVIVKSLVYQGPVISKIDTRNKHWQHDREVPAFEAF